jgi:hypothetical protein
MLNASGTAAQQQFISAQRRTDPCGSGAESAQARRTWAADFSHHRTASASALLLSSVMLCAYPTCGMASTKQTADKTMCQRAVRVNALLLTLRRLRLNLRQLQIAIVSRPLHSERPHAATRPSHRRLLLSYETGFKTLYLLSPSTFDPSFLAPVRSELLPLAGFLLCLNPVIAPKMPHELPKAYEPYLPAIISREA